METNDLLMLHLAIILIAANLVTVLMNKIKQPPVIGLLLLGIVIGPTVLNIVESDVVIKWVSKIGVLFLLFEAGLETNLKKIKEESAQAMLPALGGVLFPLGLAFVLYFFSHGRTYEYLVIGSIFTATSVSVSVVTLMDIGKLKSIEGRTIVNAAIIDDILGILLVTFIFGLGEAAAGGQGAGVHILFSVLKIIGFFLLIILFGYYFFKPIFNNLKKVNLDPYAMSIGIAIILLYAWLAELTGIAGITGAYFAGLFIAQTEQKKTIEHEISIIGKAMFVTVFFVDIGLEVDLFSIHANSLYVAAFVVLAVVGKFFGSYLGARFTGFDNLRSLRIGAGMLPRGEVALIIANMAALHKIIRHDDLSATIIMVIISTLITPSLLRTLFVKFKPKTF